MAFDRAAARAAGYSDEEIDAYLQQKKTQPEMPTGDMPPPPAVSELPEKGFDVNEMATTMAAGASQYALPAAGAAVAGGAGYGLYKFGKNITDVGRDVAQAMRERTAVEAAREARMANRPGFGGMPAAGQPPVGTPPPPAASTPSAAAPGSQFRAAGPVSPQPIPQAAPMPQPAATPTNQPNMARQVAQMAFDRLSSAARGMAPTIRGGLGALAAFTPGNVGQNYPFPTSGPMAGREINPSTQRPWTKQELDAYNAQQGMR